MVRPVPPGNPLQRLDLWIGKAPPCLTCRIAGDDRVRKHVPGDNGPCADDSSVPDRHPGQNPDASADPDVVPDHDRPPRHWVTVGKCPGELGSSAQRISAHPIRSVVAPGEKEHFLPDRAVGADPDKDVLIPSLYGEP